jgi:hypothetical protein
MALADTLDPELDHVLSEASYEARMRREPFTTVHLLQFLLTSR